MGSSMYLWFQFLRLQRPLRVDLVQGCKSFTLGSINGGEKTWVWPCASQSVCHGDRCRKHVDVSLCASRSKSGEVKLERSIFDCSWSPGEVKGVESSYEREDGGLIPQRWLTLQDDLHKTKSEKKLELRLQEIENSLQRAAEWQLKKQNLENDSMLLKEKVVHSADLTLKSVEQLAQEHIIVGPETMARLKVKEDSKSCPTEKFFSKESELDCWFNKDEIARLKRSAPDLTKFFCEKWPPLQVLVSSGQFFFLDEFLKSHVDLNSMDEDGYTPLHRAVLGRKETAVSQLLRAGADVNVLDEGGASFLHHSVQTGSLNLVRLFVKCGVDLNHSDKDGWTALHVAALTGREDIVRHLLVSGADKHLKTKEGHTPLDLCLASGKGYRTFAVAKNLKRLPRENILTAPELELQECPTTGEGVS